MTSYRTTFMSHAHTDNVLCVRYANALRAKGVDVWLDLHDMEAGQILTHNIEYELQRREAFVLMMTPTSLQSYWVGLERSAFQNIKSRDQSRMIVPMRIIPVTVPPLLDAMLWIDATAMSFDQAVDALAHALIIPSRTAADLAPTVRRPPAIAAVARDPIPVPTRLARLGFQGYAVKGVEVIVPPVCAVPAGAFTMGSDKALDPQAQENEMPQYDIPVAAFQMGTYPVTVAEYAKAVEAGVVKPPVTRTYPEVDSVAVAWRGRDLTWEAQQQRPDHPVVCVSWFDALTYVTWLSQVTGQNWRLPTEAEWEKAARWDPVLRLARIYPWGDQWDKRRANTIDGGPGLTTGIGTYAAHDDASPYRVHDMAGNVWEWTSSIRRDRPPYHARTSENDRDNVSPRVLRGGSWDFAPWSARAAYRNGDEPGRRRLSNGFRLALDRAY